MIGWYKLSTQQRIIELCVDMIDLKLSIVIIYLWCVGFLTCDNYDKKKIVPIYTNPIDYISSLFH